MAGSVNKVILIGNLGADPEVRTLESGQKVANIRLATNRSFNNRDGQRVEETEWHRVEVWGKLADITAQYLQKGRTVYIEGRLRTRKWVDQNGVERYSTDIVAETLTMLGRGNEDSRPQNAEQSAPVAAGSPVTSNPTSAPIAQTSGEEDDLPF
jgi:single-strand DNA-binding protein